jgi:hypothetical protein
LREVSPDREVVENHHVCLSAERPCNGNGRTHTITVTCADDAGNTVVRTVTVTVPKNQSGN